MSKCDDVPSKSLLQKKSTFHVILQGIIRKLEGKIHFLIAHVMDIKIGAVWNISQKKRFCL